WGCTMMFNKPIVDIAFPIPPNCYLHDIWISLVAATLGKIDYVTEPTMLYRNMNTIFVDFTIIALQLLLKIVLRRRKTLIHFLLGEQFRHLFSTNDFQKCFRIKTRSF